MTSKIYAAPVDHLQTTQPPPASLGWTMWGLCAAFYQVGFSLMLAWLILSFILILLTKETYCRQLV